MRILGVGLFILLLAGCGEDNSAERAAERAERLEQQQQELQEIEDMVRAELGELDESWSELEFLDSREGNYRFTIIYREDIPTPSQRDVSHDTSEVVRATLRTLMDIGTNPREEWVNIHVHARQTAGTGETGAQLVRPLGRSSYNYNTDQIEFELP